MFLILILRGFFFIPEKETFAVRLIDNKRCLHVAGTNFILELLHFGCTKIAAFFYMIPKTIRAEMSGTNSSGFSTESKF